MPLYKYTCQCGVKDFEQYLKEDKSSKVLKCVNCNKYVTARRVFDPSTKETERDGVVGFVDGTTNTT